MKFRVDLLTRPFPGKTTAGALALSTAALIRGNGSVVLFDTGGMAVFATVRNALSQLNVELSDVTAIFCSHLHFDHIDNIAAFPNAKLYFGKTEWKTACENIDQWTSLASLQYIEREREYCLLEDGDEFLPGMTAVYTPGHTWGHMSLLLIDEDGTVVLAGDAIKNRSELDLEESTQYVSMEDSQASIRRIKALASKILPGHDCWLEVAEDGTVVPDGDLTLNVILPEGYAEKEFCMCIDKNSYKRP